jgi:phosphohistidine phosphatase SixA
MKITLIRHGKANDTLPNMKDFDRELTKEGENELINNFKTSITELQSIDLIICS